MDQEPVTRDQILARLDSLLKKAGVTNSRIQFQLLDYDSLTELCNLLHYLESRMERRISSGANISNRCSHVCLERRADRSHPNDSLLICGLDRRIEVRCRFMNDADARQMCPDYHID